MSHASKRAEGAAEELGGKIKQAVGHVLGNDAMEASGKARKLEGQAKQEAAKSAERVQGKVEELTGALKNRVGALLGNEQMQVEGKVKELKGEARQEANR
ncbi:MAG: CsbD family protein [Holophagales bacterium]|nr:MAG: CsbD family protein [Holophagales bacterium]